MSQPQILGFLFQISPAALATPSPFQISPELLPSVRQGEKHRGDIWEQMDPCCPGKRQCNREDKHAASKLVVCEHVIGAIKCECPGSSKHLWQRVLDSSCFLSGLQPPSQPPLALMKRSP